MLGPLEAWHNGTPLNLGDPQQRFVLVVLLLRANMPVSVDRFTDIVWDGKPERGGSVRNYMNRLRKTFRDAGADDVAIETTPTGYVLRVDEDRIDLLRFNRLREAARAACDPRREIELLRAAVGLRRDEFLADIDHDRIGGTDLVSPDVAYLDAVGDLAKLELESGDHRSARDRLRTAVRMDPTRQPHAELLMRALIAGGDRVAALRVFADAQAALAELGLEPGTLLRNLAARAERGEPVSSLPSRPGGFTGRGEEFAAIEAAAAAGCRVVWISGAPGVGKSGLAIEAAHRLRDRFPDGQLLVRLNGYTPNVSATTQEDALAQLLAEMVPVEQIPPTLGRKCTAYQTELYGTRRLLVLDNAESPEQVRPLIPTDPGCLAIVTSRRMGEPGVGAHLRLAPLPRAEAVELFRGLADSPRLHGKSAELDLVVKRCGYLPMSIVVTAALFRRHARWPLEHLVQLLEESGPCRTEADEVTIAARVSYRLLERPQQHMFRLFGHLPGPDLDVVGAAALVDHDIHGARALLDHLHEVCLLEEVAPERYQMLDPLKEFAAAQPPTTPTERAGALGRLLDYYLVSLSSAVGTAYPFDRAMQPASDRRCALTPVFTGQEAALGWIDAERDNLVAAIRYAANHGSRGHAWRLAVLIWRYFNTTSQMEDWIETMGLAREIVAATPDEYGQAHLLLRLTTAHNRLGRLVEARELAEQALPLWARLGDVRGEAATLCALAIPTMELGRYDQATDQLTTALAKYEQCSDLRGQAHALSTLGYINEQRGELDVALRQHEAAVPMLRQVRHTQGLAHALNNLGSVQRRLGQVDLALDNHLEAYDKAREAGDTCAEAYALNYIGNVHRSQGRLAEARHHQERAGKVAAKLSDADLRIQLYHDRGTTALAAGDLLRAWDGYQAALDLADGAGNRTHQAPAHHGLARTLHAMGKHTEAAAHWGLAETAFAALDQPEAAEVRAERAAMGCPCQAPPGSR
ncbi:tetratricopeptide repeat protein [Actinokineospora auranticolor]|uniref:DNA-binding SARP family transcriptional activator n=1 Tax=Actinokineospora auranticolor TaxID=155976 RepID=A0A2S6GHW8_9PSEU|nr:tetratricopeptide repeat protein [Actinokineospora auranticolor]PPK64824.1 DNA-binding SARP family transcriptional activator [Actinokineospora auranticolor]